MHTPTEADLIQKRHRLPALIFGSDHSRHHHVLKRGQLWEKIIVLKDIPHFTVSHPALLFLRERIKISPFDMDPAPFRAFKARKRIKKSSFTSSAHPTEKNSLSPTDLKIYATEHFYRFLTQGVSPVDVPRRNQGALRHSATSRLSWPAFPAQFAHATIILDLLTKIGKLFPDGRFNFPPKKGIPTSSR